MWISDDNNPWLRAHDRDTKQRVESEDILLYKDGHGFMALGIWSDGTTMWVNAMPYRWYPGRTAFSSGIYTVDLSTGDIERADGFEGLRDANGRRRSRGIWSDGETMWVAAPNGKIQAYDLDTGARRSNFDIATTLGQRTAAGPWRAVVRRRIHVLRRANRRRHPHLPPH